MKIGLRELERQVEAEDVIEQVIEKRRQSLRDRHVADGNIRGSDPTR